MLSLITLNVVLGPNLPVGPLKKLNIMSNKLLKMIAKKHYTYDKHSRIIR